MTARHMSMAEAVEAGADAFFDEKYGELVRTIAVEGYSHELCGGTHCRATGQIGGFIITGERSIGSGMRRIEAVTGEAAEALTDERFRSSTRRSRRPGRRPPSSSRRGSRSSSVQRAAAPSVTLPSPAEVARSAVAHAEGTARRVPGGVPRPPSDMKAWAKDVRSALGSGVIAAGTRDTPDPQLFVTVSDDLVAAGPRRVRPRARGGGGVGRQGRRPAGDGAGPDRRTGRARTGDGEAARAAPGLAGAPVEPPQAPPRTRPSDGAPGGPSTALDIGTEYAKALVFTTNADGEAEVTGRRAPAPGPVAHAVGDRRRHPRRRAQLPRRARRGRGDGRARSTSVVIGIAGELVKGFTTSLSVERRRPDTPITEAELDRLIEDAERAAIAEAQRTITWETGLPNVDVKLVHAAVAGAGIDGYAVTNPIGFQGRHIRITVFNAYAPLVHLAALEAVVSRLGLELLKVVAEPYAVARSLAGDQITQSGALFIDVGGGTTDVALVRQGSVEGTRMFALGGRAFTKSLADRLDLPFDEAERVKVDHAAGRPRRAGRARRGDRRGGRRRLVGRRRARARGVRQAGSPAGSHRALRRRRGTARDPRALEAPGFAADLPFARRPSVSLMTPGEVTAVHDRTGLLVDQQDVTPMALAVQALEAKREREPLDAALERVLRGDAGRVVARTEPHARCRTHDGDVKTRARADCPR